MRFVQWSRCSVALDGPVALLAPGLQVLLLQPPLLPPLLSLLLRQSLQPTQLPLQPLLQALVARWHLTASNCVAPNLVVGPLWPLPLVVLLPRHRRYLWFPTPLSSPSRLPPLLLARSVASAMSRLMCLWPLPERLHRALMLGPPRRLVKPPPPCCLLPGLPSRPALML